MYLSDFECSWLVGWIIYFPLCTWVDGFMFQLQCCFPICNSPPSPPPLLHIFLLFLVSSAPALLSLLGKRLWLGSAGQHSPGSAWLFFMLVDILLCTYSLSSCGSPLLLTSYTWTNIRSGNCGLPLSCSFTRSLAAEIQLHTKTSWVSVETALL